MFAERIPLPTAMTSADAGVSFHYNLPSNYGDIHVGVYNGENYQRVEVNDQKAFEFRGTVRPFARSLPDPARRARASRLLRRPLRRQRRAQARDGQRDLRTQLPERRVRLPERQGPDAGDCAERVEQGYSIWATPRVPLANGASWEGLLRYDHFTPNTAATPAPASTSPVPGITALNDQNQNRTIVGVAYWFPHQGNVSTAILVDYDGQNFDNITTAPAAASRCTGCSISRRSDS